MTDPAALLRSAADAVDDCVLSDREKRTIALLALHVKRACGAGYCPEEARLLMELLEG